MHWVLFLFLFGTACAAGCYLCNTRRARSARRAIALRWSEGDAACTFKSREMHEVDVRHGRPLKSVLTMNATAMVVEVDCERATAERAASMIGRVPSGLSDSFADMARQRSTDVVGVEYATPAGELTSLEQGDHRIASVSVRLEEDRKNK